MSGELSNDPTFPQVIITVDPDTMRHTTVFEGSLPLDIWIGILNDLISKTENGDLPFDQS